MDRRVLFVVGLVASVAVTAVLWALGFPGFFLFLLLPFLWFPSRQPKAKAASCPACGSATQPSFTFCPACGGRL